MRFPLVLTATAYLTVALISLVGAATPTHSCAQRANSAPTGQASNAVGAQPDTSDVLWVRTDPIGSDRRSSGAGAVPSATADVPVAHLLDRVLRPDREPRPAVGGSASASVNDDTTRDANATGTTAQLLTLEDAIRVALERNFDLRGAELDVADATAQVKEARGSIFPRVDVSGSYTRNIQQANPFAGSDVSSFLGGGSQSDWVAFNERARTDGDPGTDPIPFEEFRQRQLDAQQAAGIQVGSSSNPFGVDNEFLGSVQLTQTLYDKSAFSALQGAQQFQDASQRGLDRQAQVVANDVYDAFYAALLAREQVRVIEQREARTQETFQEVSTQVRQGVAPKLERLSAEVELSNLRTELIQAQNDANLALDQLKVTLGLSVDADIRLDGVLETPSQDLFVNVSAQDAISRAVEQRADLQRAQLAIELREIEQETIEAQYYPTLEALATFSYTGRVPDNREQILTDPNDPFFYGSRERGFFSNAYWNPTLSAGLRMSWNVFNGFQTTARMEQQDIAISRAQLQRDQLRQSIELEVSSAVRRLETARQRIQSQRQTVSTAETNYRFIERRLTEGVSNPLQLRDASDQLDRSRLNYLQAVYDYLVARSDLETAIGTPLTPAARSYQTTSRDGDLESFQETSTAPSDRR